jgi:hypothetical protein
MGVKLAKRLRCNHRAVSQKRPVLAVKIGQTALYRTQRNRANTKTRSAGTAKEATDLLDEDSHMSVVLEGVTGEGHNKVPRELVCTSRGREG